MDLNQTSDMILILLAFWFHCFGILEELITEPQYDICEYISAKLLNINKLWI